MYNKFFFNHHPHPQDQRPAQIHYHVHYPLLLPVPRHCLLHSLLHHSLSRLRLRFSVPPPPRLPPLQQGWLFSLPILLHLPPLLEELVQAE